MVVLEVNDVSVSLNLTNGESFGSVSCCCQPKCLISNIQRVIASEDLWSELKGVRIAGTGIPYSMALGTRMYWEGKDFCIVYYNTPGLIIEFQRGPYKRWLISTSEYREIAADLEAKVDAFGRTDLVPPHRL